MPWNKLLVLDLVSLVLGHDAGPVRLYIEVHAERFRRGVHEKGLRALLDAQATLQRAVTESTETDFYSTLASSTVVL